MLDIVYCRAFHVVVAENVLAKIFRISTTMYGWPGSAAGVGWGGVGCVCLRSPATCLCGCGGILRFLEIEGREG
jgi:hypothetical protein